MTNYEKDQLIFDEINGIDNRGEIDFDFLSISVDVDESINKGKDSWGIG